MRTRIIIVITALLGLWTWLCPGALAAETLRVDAQAGNCSDTGGASYCHIQAAIDQASPGATVEIAAGVYELWGESLFIDKSLTLRGAGADRTVLDGNGRHPGPLISIADTAADVSIRALTLTNRMRIVSPTAGAGGGIALTAVASQHDTFQSNFDFIATGIDAAAPFRPISGDRRVA